jgi:NAD(P)-dependent dehydrogenase (short-subunit alcohol dehydrogenase family)
MDWYEEHVPDQYEQVLAEVPLGRVGDCELDIGRAVVFLCSPAASYMTGSSLMVDGGQTYLR